MNHIYRIFLKMSAFEVPFSLLRRPVSTMSQDTVAWIKIKYLFPTPDQLLENVATENIFFVCDLMTTLFILFWLPKIITKSFRYCSRIYIWNWSLFYIIKIYCSNWQRTRFVSNERSIEASLLKMLLSNVVLENILEKNPPTYPPIGEMEGQVQEKTYFSGWSWI